MPIPDHQKEMIIKLAKPIRIASVGTGGSLLGRCDVLAPPFRDALLEKGIPATMVVGSFRVDHVLTEDLAQFYDCADRARHVWLEVQGYIVDATADQFNKFLIKPVAEIVIGSYEDHPRYVKEGPWPVVTKEEGQVV